MLRRLFGYMAALIVIVVIVMLASLSLMGRFHTDKAELLDTLELQMDFWEKTIVARSDALAAVGIDLSESLEYDIEAYLSSQGLTTQSLAHDAKAQADIQSIMLPILQDYLSRADASGAYVILDATVNSDSSTHSGVYIQKKTLAPADSAFLLYRGNATIGKEHGIMPHRKWRLELENEIFSPNDQVFDYSAFPYEWSYTYTPIVNLPGTSEQATLLQVPLLLSDGTFIGVCGFEVNQTYFKQNTQPAIYPQLTFVLSSLDNNCISSDKLVTGTTSNYFINPTGPLHISQEDQSILKFQGDSSSFAGLYRPLSLGNETTDFALAVMLPYEQYANQLTKSFIQSILLMGLMVVFAGACCFLFSKNYLIPIVKGLEQLKTSRDQDATGVYEIDDLFSFLLQQDKDREQTIRDLTDEKDSAQNRADIIQQKYDEVKREFENAQSKQLKVSKIQHINPQSDEYQAFQIGLTQLTVTERKIVQYYFEGKTVKDIQEILHIKETTLRYHNRNIYSKLGVHSLKQLLQFALYANDQQK